MNIFGGGWGGRPREDGEDASVSVCQGDVRNSPVELQEIRYPVIVEEHALRQDSGGAGKYRGGLGVRLTYRVEVPCKVTINCERTRCPPWGIAGGGSGATNTATIKPKAGGERVVLKGTEIPLAPGDVVAFETAGGGGYGNPEQRPRPAVESDLKQGFITTAGARAYG